MAIAVDSARATGNYYQATLNGYTYSHTCTGSNLILFVAGFGSPGVDSVTGITYGGVSLTKIGAKNTGGPDNRYSYLWYLLNPATGANNVVITTSGGDGTSASVSYTGVNQSGQPDAFTTNSTAGTPATTYLTSLTSIADNCWFIISNRNEAGPNAAGAGATLRVSDTSGNGIFDSNSAKTPAGSYSMTVGSTSSTHQGLVMASFKPVAAVAVSNQPTLLTLGVG